MGLAIGSKRRRWRSENAEEADPREQVKFKLTLLRLVVLIAFGALIYAKFTYFPHSMSNLTQQIGSRLALTGIVFSVICGLADVLGFGSHAGVLAGDVVIGQFQIAGIIGSFVLSSIGVLIYVLGGMPE